MRIRLTSEGKRVLRGAKRLKLAVSFTVTTTGKALETKKATIALIR